MSEPDLSTLVAGWVPVYVVSAFLVGALAGYQGVYERYQHDSGRAVATVPGSAYLVTRGLLPSVVFGGLLAFGAIDSMPLLYALACGTGVELILRTRFYVRSENNGSIEEILRGPFDLLRWYQGRFLESASTSVASRRKKQVRAGVPKDVPFPRFCERVLQNLSAWPDASVQAAVRTAVSELKSAYDTDQNRSDSLSAERLGYRIWNLVGPKGFSVLVTE